MDGQSEVGELSKEQEVAPQAVKARVLEFFEGVDLGSPGKHRNGLIDVVVIDPDTAHAEINGYELASLESDAGTRLFTLNGHQLDDSRESRDVTLWAEENEKGAVVSCIELPPAESGRDYRSIDEPQELATVARTLGVKI